MVGANFEDNQPCSLLLTLTNQTLSLFRETNIKASYLENEMVATDNFFRERVAIDLFLTII